MTRKVGRPTKYKEEFCELAYKYSLLSATDEDLARFFEIDVATLYRWKNEHPDFCEAIKEGKEIADTNVANRLYNRAVGYEHDDIELKVVSRGGNLGSEVQEIPVKKYYPPDTTAAIFWLKNRQPKAWRDRVEVDQSGDIVVRFEGVSPLDLDDSEQDL
jgi:hypothetical protein